MCIKLSISKKDRSDEQEVQKIILKKASKKISDFYLYFLSFKIIEIGVSQNVRTPGPVLSSTGQKMEKTYHF